MIPLWWIRLRCWFGFHVVWLGDLRRFDVPVPLILRQYFPDAETPWRVDSPCLECGTILEADYGLAYGPKIRSLWNLDEYMPLDEAYAYELAVKLCER